MSTTFMPQAAYNAAQDLKSTDITLTRSQISEVIAALLGYGSYAALIVEQRRTDIASMADAECFIIDVEAGKRRASTLGCLSLQRVVDACWRAIGTASGRPVYLHPEEFLSQFPWFFKDDYDSFFKEEVEWTVSRLSGGKAKFIKAGRAGIKRWTIET